jgi:hypothetical protein
VYVSSRSIAGRGWSGLVGSLLDLVGSLLHSVCGARVAPGHRTQVNEF